MNLNFSPLQSTPPVTQYSDLNATSTAENIVLILHGNAIKGCQQFSLNLCNIIRMPQFQILLHSLERKNVARSEMGQVGRVGHNHHFVFSQKKFPTLPY
jgi:hypothetical protein